MEMKFEASSGKGIRSKRTKVQPTINARTRRYCLQPTLKYLRSGEREALGPREIRFKASRQVIFNLAHHGSANTQRSISSVLDTAHAQTSL